MRPLRRDHFLDHGIAGEAVDRAVKVDVERNQPRQRRFPVDRAPGAQRRLKLRAPGCVGLDPCRRELGRERVDRAAHFIELADTFRIELDDFKAATAALGDQALPVQQMQRMGNRLARHPEFFGEFVLPNAMPWRQRAVGDRLQNTRVDLIDQVRKRIQRDHVDRPLEYGIPYSLGQSSSRVKPGDAKRV